MKIFHQVSSVLLCCGLAFSQGVAAQSGPIKILNAFGKTGSSSQTAAIIAPKLEQYLKTPVELTFGEGSKAGMGAPADGKSVVMSTIGLMALLPSVMPGYPVDPLTHFRPVTRTTQTPDMLVVRSGLGIKTIKELVAYTQKHPHQLKYFHIAPTSIHRLEFAALFGELGISATLDKSRASGNDDAMAGIRDGTLDLLISTSPYMTQLTSSGAAVPLAVINPTRMPLFPEVPTFLELGASTMSSGSWAGMFMPAGTSDADLDRVFKAVRFAMSDPAVAAAISALGMEVNTSESPTDFSNFVRAEMQRLKSAAQKYNFKTN